MHSFNDSLIGLHRLGTDTKFVTAKPDGTYQDHITVESQTINGIPFTGILVEWLGRESSMLYSIGRGIIFSLKLKSQIDIDQLKAKEYFDLS
jgi:hypothetical protein